MVFQQKIEARGLKSFDTALPQDWYDLVYDRLNVNPSGHVVWCYDDSMFGYPRAIDDEGDRIVGIMAGGAR